ncbi:tetratricopeptide repeat protein [Pannonibacter phragmitetus]|uniref:Tetratricopeptide repeat protein n=1 Tax=Pannonibacter phragmitetus TaxID=121719 RepID=A0A379A012_9HYPH|nr:heme biosynthesis HemY N-terminal domain-containing protein [Pannonibacter phragmitetus]SUB02824.1 tetratricopeptide repeat protein [Pannonibacter phragmitetus]
MIRVFVFFAALFAAALGFAWLADLPGMVSVTWNGYIWEQPPATVAVVVIVGLALFLGAVWLALTVLRSPKIASRFFRRRRRDRGYQALSSGLLALGTGNAKLARKHGLEACKLLPGEPAAQLLIAQAAQMSGDRDEARRRFETMLEDPRTRVLGLHGLFIEAEREGAPAAARHYAEEALKAQPSLDWAGKAVLGYQAVASDWEAAIATLEKNYTARLIGKPAYRRQRAVLLTARALELEDSDPDQAMQLAREAHGLAGDLVPAAAVTARLATRKGDVRKAAKVLEATWRLSPHPDLAEAYAHARIGDAAADRLKRVKTLAALRPNTAEGALAIARVALDAREFAEARAQLKKVLRSEPTRNAFLLMADLEEAESGDKGRMREWLARAVRAPLDKAWIADGVVSSVWSPVSPVTGRLDAFVWDTPPAPSGALALDLPDEALFDRPGLAAPQEAAAEAARPSGPFDMPVRSPKPEAGGEPVMDLTPEPAATPAATLAETPGEKPAGAAAATVNGAAAPQPGKPASAPASAAAVAPVDVINPAASQPVDAPAPDNAGSPVRHAAAYPFPRLPDDPGPEAADDVPLPKPKFVN